jgi:glycosyltransferase involved in cell wall biosynthesis
VLEAMALGKAIVTTSIGSEGITLRHGDNAVFADDAAAFADATLELLDSPERIARMGQSARRLAEAEYGWDAIGAKLLDCYAPLLARRASALPAITRLGAIEA